MTTTVVERRCEACDALLASTSRANRRYCSPACRQRAYERRRPRVSRAQTPAAPVVPVPGQTELAAALERAVAEERLVALVAAHASSRSTTSWRAAAWLLERRFPERWGAQRERVAVAASPAADDVFAEVDELAERRRRALERGKLR